MQKFIWFAGGLLLGLTALSITRASVPTKSRVSDDTAIYQKLSEIKGVQKQPKLDVDQEIRELSLMENRYHEKLPTLAQNPRLKGPLQRVSQQRYQSQYRQQQSAGRFQSRTHVKTID